MGGYYPANSAGWGHLPDPVPGRDFPPAVDPRRDPYNPRRFKPQPKYPWRPPGYFPNGWKPKRVPFGKRIPTTFPFVTPDRFASRLPLWPGVAVGALILPYIFAPKRLTLEGFKTCFDIGPPQEVGRTLSSGCLPSLMGQSGQVFHWAVENATWPATTNTISILLGQRNPAGTRATWRFMATKLAPIPLPAFGPAPLPQVPRFVVPPFFQLPWWDPAAWWPTVPVPYVPPVPRPVWEPSPYTPSFPVPVVSGPVPQPRPLTEPGIQVTPRGPTKVRPGHTRVKPRPRDRERKFAGRKGFAHILAAWLLRVSSGVYNGITETVDLVSAIYSALPSEIIARHPNNLPQKDILPFMLGAIYRHIDQIDMQEALTNVAKNAIEDAAWGRYFAAVSKVTDRGTNYSGYDRELSELNDLFREIYNL